MINTSEPEGRRRRWGRIAASVAGSTAALAAAGAAWAGPVPASSDDVAATQPSAPAAAAAPQMSQLAVFNGKWTCDYRHTGDNTSVRQTFTGQPVLGGAAYQIDQYQAPTAQQPTPFSTRSLIVGNAATNEFTDFYADSQGNLAPGTSAGWHDGHFIVISDITSKTGNAHTSKDDFTMQRSNKFLDTISAQVNGAWIEVGTLSCTRTR